MSAPPLVRPSAFPASPPTSVARWADRVRRAEALALEPTERAVVVAPHPDDETLGAGGVVATMGRAGGEVTVLAVTDGEASHPDVPGLGTRRRREQRRALHHLGWRVVCDRLAVPDGEVVAHAGLLADALTALVDAATTVVAPWRGDGHPDHDACGEVAHRVAAAAGARLLSYPIWLWQWAPATALDGLPVRRLDLGDEVHRSKGEALAAFRSQLEGDDPILTADVLARAAWPWEVFVDERPAVAESSTVDPCAAEAFEARYRDEEDPWDFAGSPSEQARYDAILDVLGPGPFRSAYEPGCSVGVLTARLAHRCHHLRAVDVSPTAVDRARERCDGRPEVTFDVASVAEDRTGDHDLVVASEIGYYFSGAALDGLVDRLVAALLPGGTLLACHWLGHSDDHAVGGRWVHTRFGRTRARPHRPPRGPDLRDRHLAAGVTEAHGWSVGVVVPARDEGERIGACVASIEVAVAEAGVAASALVVVADGCGDDTVAAARRALGRRGQVVECAVGSVGRARARGVVAVRARLAVADERRLWLATTDADTVVAPDWLVSQLRCAARGAAAVAGIVRVDHFDELGAGVGARWRSSYATRPDGTHNHVHGANLCVRADAYRAGWRTRPPARPDLRLELVEVVALDDAGDRGGARSRTAAALQPVGRHDGVGIGGGRHAAARRPPPGEAGPRPRPGLGPADGSDRALHHLAVAGEDRRATATVSSRQPSATTTRALRGDAPRPGPPRSRRRTCRCARPRPGADHDADAAPPRSVTSGARCR